jgi:flagellar basal-body rod protein FlgB
MSLFDKTSDALAASLRMRQIRHNVTSANIANAETPHYHAKKVDFENALASAIETQGVVGDSLGGKPIDNLKADVYENPDVAVNNDGNTVDLEKEMSALSENSILYKSALQLINKKMAALKYALGER